MRLCSGAAPCAASNPSRCAVEYPYRTCTIPSRDASMVRPPGLDQIQMVHLRFPWQPPGQNIRWREPIAAQRLKPGRLSPVGQIDPRADIFRFQLIPLRWPARARGC